MSNLRQNLAIGDTGTQLVTKFNANATKANIRVYNVEDYGAMHDGVTDDTVAIQTAINACHTAEGGTVYFPNGIYLLSGALQTDIDGVNPNSQLYIPSHASGKSINIKLRGESYDHYGFLGNNYGVILKSTIAGTGVFPSVICAMGIAGAYGPMNYNTPEVENFKIVVDAFEATTGPSMCGINFIYASHSYINNVTACIDCVAADSIIPENHVFGIASGFLNNDFPRVGKIIAKGFYYGVVLGEGVKAESVQSYYNYIGLMVLRNPYAVNIQQCVMNWNAYSIAAQQETIYGQTAHDGDLRINYLTCEDGYSGDGRTPSWCWRVDNILDTSNLLHGFVDYQWSAEAGLGIDITKSNGGNNLLIRNMRHTQTYKWNTATRPNISGSAGIMGYNSTIGKMECWDGSTWVALS